MAAVSLFWTANMVAVTSRDHEKRFIQGSKIEVLKRFLIYSGILPYGDPANIANSCIFILAWTKVQSVTFL